MTTYIGLLRKDPGTDFGVEFPDFLGCTTAGRSLEEVHWMAVEALGLHITGMIADDDIIPEPSGLNAIMADPAAREGVAVLIEAPAPQSRSVRVNITLPEVTEPEHG